jgi:single-strand DNA-binding protein
MLFTGRVAGDAEVKTVKGDKKVINFTVAVNKRWKDRDGERHEKTAFIECAYWINSGLAEFLKKGTIVEISGWMEASAWANRDGEPQANLICSVDTVKLFGKPAPKQDGKPQGKKPSGVKANANGGDEDDLPF